MNQTPYFVSKSCQTWTGWNPYDRGNPVRSDKRYEVKYICDYLDFSFWGWNHSCQINQVIIFSKKTLEVGYLGYYPGGYCVSLYVDPEFRRMGLGTKLLEVVPQVKVFREEVGSFNKKVDKQDPLHSTEYLLEWYSKRKVLR